LKTTKYAHTVITYSSAEYIGQSAAYQCDGRLYSENARHECSLGEKMAGAY
jgi:hypothetical protein